MTTAQTNVDIPAAAPADRLTMEAPNPSLQAPHPLGLRRVSLADSLSQIAALRSRLEPCISAHLDRRRVGKRHPVYDFLFDYYSFSTGQLLRWTPGVNVHVELQPGYEPEWPDHVRLDETGYVLDCTKFPERRIPYLHWAIRFLTTVADRPPVFHCFGLHEWAMVYKSETVRYPDIPLRVTSREIEQVIESAPLRCTHYDAFRFFSPVAAPLNRSALRADTVTENDQPGCVHVNMDLYRFGYKIAPYTPSALLGELFLLALSARELDMCASPYDLTAHGFEAIPIETRTGREQYVDAQRALAERSRPLRRGLLAVYRELLATITGPGS